MTALSRIIGISLLLIIVSDTYAQNEESVMTWYKWEDGYKKAFAENKILMVYLFTNNCPHCVKMQKETFSNSKIVAMIDQDFIAVKVNPKEAGVSYRIDDKVYNGNELISYLTGNSMFSQSPRMVYPTTAFIIPGADQFFLESGFQAPKTFRYILLNSTNIKKSLKK